MESILFLVIIIGAFLGVSGVFISAINDLLGFRLFLLGCSLLVGGLLVFAGGCLVLTV